MKKLIEAVQKAAQDTANYMTYDARESAHAHGWNSHEADSIRVRYTDGEFHVHAEGDHAEHALSKEYGTETQRPTAVMRKYANNSGRSGEVFMAHLNRHAGGNK